MITATTIFKTLAGQQKTVRRADPMYCTLDKTRVRFSRMIDADTVEVLDNDGKVLPDWRHPSQLLAY